MVFFDSEEDKDIKERQIGGVSEVEELSGTLSKQKEEDKLMHTVLEADKDTIDDGKVITESINRGLGSFTPNLMFQNLVKDYKHAKKLYGETILRQLTGYDPNYVEKNLSIPEFRREIEKNMIRNVEKLKEKGVLDKEGVVTKKGYKLSSLIMYTEELDKLIPKGFGEKETHKRTIYGDKKDYKAYEKTRYRDIAIKQSVKTAIRRRHPKLEKHDLRIFERESKGKINIIYGIDASGSMKGEKLIVSKKAGIALAFKAINEKNKVGLIVFGSEIKSFIEPCQDFNLLLDELTKVRASRETDIKKAIKKSIELFPRTKITKHLVLLSDALPTKGEKPELQTLKAASIARDNNITISLVGINLDRKGQEFAKKLVEVGNGRLFIVRDLENLDKIILEDYYMAKA